MTDEIKTPPAEMFALKIVVTHLLDAVRQMGGRKWFDDARASCLSAVERANIISNVAIDEAQLRLQAADLVSQLFDGVDANAKRDWNRSGFHG